MYYLFKLLRKLLHRCRHIFHYLFIQRRLSTQDKITKQQQNDNVTAQSKVPIKVQNIQNIKSQYWKFMSSSWGPARVTSLKWKLCLTSNDSKGWLTDTGSFLNLRWRMQLESFGLKMGCFLSHMTCHLLDYLADSLHTI